MSNSEEKQGCPETGQGQKCKDTRKGQCPWLRFCGKEGGETGAPSQNEEHNHDNGACPFLAKVRGCSGDKKKKDGIVPQECATWMCWYYYMLGRHGSHPWTQFAQGHAGAGFAPPFFSESDSSDSEDEQNVADGMDTEAVGETAPEAEGETESGEDGQIPIGFVQSACWAYYMMGSNELGHGPPPMGPPHMGPWGHSFDPRPYTGFAGVDPRGHGGPPMMPGGFGPFGFQAMGPFGGFGHHHGGPPPFGPFGHPSRCHRHHKHDKGHGAAFMFPGMPGGSHRGHCHHRHHGGPHCGRGGFKRHMGPACPHRLLLSKTEKMNGGDKKME